MQKSVFAGTRKVSIPIVILACSFSLVAQAQIGPPPVITVQPSDQTVLSGGTANFSVLAISGTYVTYQWRLNGTNIPGATGQSCTQTNVQAAHAGLYSVKVSNAAGSVISSNAILEVTQRVEVTYKPLRFVSSGCDTNGFKGRLEGPVGANYVILFSTDLRTWVPICTNLSSTGTVDFVDPGSANHCIGFYRAVVQ